MRTQKPTKQDIKGILHTELLHLAQSGYEELTHLAKKQTIGYEVESAYGSYQITIHFDLSDSKEGLINVLGAIDGPGVFHFFGYVSSVTDGFSIKSAGGVEFIP